MRLCVVCGVGVLVDCIGWVFAAAFLRVFVGFALRVRVAWHRF